MAWIFPLYFQFRYLPEETCFQQAGSSVVKVICLKKPVFSKQDLLWSKVIARLYWDFLTSGRHQPVCYYF
jgi:hypothetical protein